MRVLVCPQEFKGSLTAVEAAEALAAGVRSVLADVEIDLCPLADGGPGTVDAVVGAMGLRFTTTNVDGPLGDPVAARWGRVDSEPVSASREAGSGDIAVLEMAAASGLVLVPAERLDPRRASTFGSGQLIAAALDADVRLILIGVGGSATTDGGAGAVVALGARLLDDAGRPLPPGGAALSQLARIELEGFDSRVQQTEIVVLADVRNPLVGADGASAIYGPQKGADARAVAELERALTNFADIVARDLGVAIADLPGAGAAGGLAGGLVAFAGARIESGFEAVARAVGLERRARLADLVITGEGTIDRQTGFGKAVAGVAAVAAVAGKPCIAVGGRVRDRDAVGRIAGLLEVEAAAGGDMPDDAAMREAGVLVQRGAATLLMRWFDVSAQA